MRAGTVGNNRIATGNGLPTLPYPVSETKAVVTEMSVFFVVFLGDVHKQDCTTKLNISSLSSRSFLDGTWHSGTLISLIKIAF
jgi:hypothetical protein